MDRLLAGCCWPKRAGDIVGVAALCPLFDDGVAEIKRLFVDPDARGHRVGRRLIEAIIAESRSIGYRVLRLETLAIMEAANVIYDDLGFIVVPAWDGTPSPEVICKGLQL